MPSSWRYQCRAHLKNWYHSRDTPRRSSCQWSSRAALSSPNQTQRMKCSSFVSCTYQRAPLESQLDNFVAVWWAPRCSPGPAAAQGGATTPVEGARFPGGGKCETGQSHFVGTTARRPQRSLSKHPMYSRRSRDRTGQTCPIGSTELPWNNVGRSPAYTGEVYFHRSQAAGPGQTGPWVGAGAVKPVEVGTLGAELSVDGREGTAISNCSHAL